MTDVTALSQPQNPMSPTGAIGALSADMDMFLNMLTTQMQNQDPLDPMDTSEYTQQMVQFSSVEQQIQQNATLQQILSTLSTQDMAKAASFLGTRAEFSTPVAGLTSDEPAQWSWEADRSVSSLTATIKDTSGRVIETRSIPAGNAGEFAWDGTLSNGGTAGPGVYMLELEGADANGTKVPVGVRSSGTVDDVTLADGTIQLGVNGATMPATVLVRMVSDDG